LDKSKLKYVNLISLLGHRALSSRDMDKHKDKNLNNEKVAKTVPVNELRVAFRREKRKGQDYNLKT